MATYKVMATELARRPHLLPISIKIILTKQGSFWQKVW
jgi:hypothetical protein